MANSRLHNVVRNSGASLLNRLAQILIRFVIQTLFIKVLGNEYTGVSRLFTDILTVLSLVEMGLDSSMVYALYKPLAQHDDRRITALMNFYRSAFTIIGVAVFAIGLGCVPFLRYIVKDVPDVKEDVRLLFLAYVATSGSSYFFVYKTVLIRADQRSSIISNITTIVHLAECLAEVVLILLFKEFFLYLAVRFVSTLSRNFWLSHKAEKLYPQYFQDRSVRIDRAERNDLFKNIFALIVYNLAAVVLNSTDSIFVSAFTGTAQVAIIGNFTLITNSVKSCIKMVVSASRPSIGNMVAMESTEKQRVMLKRINFITFWIACFCSTCLFCLLNPFIGDIWFGESYKIGLAIVIPLVINFYISVMSFTNGTFRSTNGLFVQGWYRPAVMAVLNLTLDYFMGKKMGAAGIYIATSISLITTQVWYDPYIVYKHVFKCKPWEYYIDYLWQAAFTVSCCALSYALSKWLSIPNKYLSFLCSALIAAILPNLAIVLCFRRTDNYAYARSVILKILRRISKKTAL